MDEILTYEESRELSRLFSVLIADIHNLSTHQTQVLMEVDEHMRGDALSKADLEALRRISAKDFRR